MTHVWFVAHSVPENLKEFEKWVEQRDYRDTDGTRHPVHCREFKIYEISVSKEVEEQLAKDLYGFHRISHMSMGKIQKVLTWISRRAGLKEFPIPAETNKPDIIPSRWVNGFVIGKVDEEVDGDGREVR